MIRRQTAEHGKTARSLLISLLLLGLGFGLYSLLGTAGDQNAEYQAEETGPATPEAEPQEVKSPEFSKNAAPGPADTGYVFPSEKVIATSGSVHGTVRLGSELHGKIRECTVTIREAINRNAQWKGKPRPKQVAKAIKFDKDTHRAHFNFEDLPFSEFGWTAYAYAPGVNGSQQFVLLKADDAVKRVLLSLSGGAIVSLLVKDQEYQPVADVEVTLVPCGDQILGRPAYGPVKSDVLGSIMISDVISGEYDLVVGDKRNPVVPIRKVTIHKGGHQFLKVAMKRGGTVICHVNLPGGYGAKGVKIEAIALSRIYHKYENTTDHRGVIEFKHLPKGKYNFHFTKKGFQRGFKKVTVPADGVVDVQVSLIWQR